ncbi:MAG TPA: putative PEP-binding protein, partial [Treponemataceae bacterium]|nr:putative PEP-binding protein [Treponemataceae bacterium]
LEDAHKAIECGAAGIGLFRTEFLFINKASKTSLLMSENEQFEIYKEVLQIMSDKPVTIRTLDAGADKIINAKGMPSGNEKNPLLGWRAIRFSLDRKDIFKTQIRALYRASVFGNLKIMIPLITHVEQLQKTKQLINEVQEELTLQNIAFNKNIPLGIMIETPSASIMSDVFAHQCDFFSLGTNDLTQYLLCVDRENTIVSNLFQELNPAVLRQIQYTILSANAASIPISVCGEMASNLQNLLLLLGMGIRTLSITPTKISEAKEFISCLRYTDLVALAKRIPLCATTADVQTIITTFLNENTIQPN